MSYFTRPVTWQVWQFGVVKVSLIALGILLGAYFAEFLMPFLWLVGIVFVVTVIPTAIWGLKSMVVDSKQ